MNKKTLSIVVSAGMLATSITPVLASDKIDVETIGGSNRYETAINVAKAQKILKFDNAEKGVNNIVLVSGNSLVDGLSASPLAALLKCKVNGNEKSAPLLLSEKNKLNSQTKKYIESLTYGIKKSNVVVNIVGGKSVISENVENELKEMGFSVERFEGKNREATSISVAEIMKKKDPNINDIYIVGGNAEADAVSIAPLACNPNMNESNLDLDEGGIKTVVPIIVNNKSCGLTKTAEEYALKFINKNEGRIRLVGGDSVFTESDFDRLVDKAYGDDGYTHVLRLYGKDRFETNEFIAGTYDADPTDTVFVVKDGYRNKSELIDALTAANYAAESNSPIIIATDKLRMSSEFITEYSNFKHANKVIQVGQGVNESVIDKLTEILSTVK